MYGNRIKILRIENGITQAELAKIIDTTAPTIGKYEREQLEPNIERISKLCNYFNVSADYILGLED